VSLIPSLAARRPSRLLVVAVWTAVGLVGLSLLAMRAGIVINEDVYPWQDQQPETVVHVTNESDQPVSIFWRWSGWKDETWYPLGPSASENRLMQGSGASMDFWDWIPATAFNKESAELKVLVGRDAVPHLVSPIPVAPDKHVRLRIDRLQDVWFASGGETWLGGPDFGEESAVVAATPR
jgi:hypothetical protein